MSDPSEIDPTLEPYFGLVKCKILPPVDLALPFLPYKCSERLMFPLCARCCENLQQTKCQCTDEQRGLLGVWTVVEVREAVELGYKIMKIFEVYHYPETTQFGGQGSDEDQGLFQVSLNLKDCMVLANFT
jgi:hypothetical protein